MSAVNRRRHSPTRQHALPPSTLSPGRFEGQACRAADRLLTRPDVETDGKSAYLLGAARPWRNWIAHRSSEPRVVGSNPTGRAFCWAGVFRDDLARISQSRPERGRKALPEQRKLFPVDTVFAKMAATLRAKFRQRRRLLVPAYKNGLAGCLTSQPQKQPFFVRRRLIARQFVHRRIG